MTLLIKTKEELRKTALEKRKKDLAQGLINTYSDLITNKIINSKEFISSSHIGLYYPIRGEISLLKLLNFKDKLFYFPRCNNQELEFCLVESVNDLHLGKFGIMEPKGEKINPDILDVIYIPTLIANSQNYRLGYGKGFYDRFFSKNNIKAKKILVLQSKFITDKFIQDSFDYKCDMIMSEI